MQIIAVVNFSPRQVAGVRSEVLVLGSDSKPGTVLLHPLEVAVTAIAQKYAASVKYANLLFCA